MTALAERLKERYFGSDEHPYRTFERRIDALIHPEATLLDAGCGRTAPVLAKYRGRVKRLIGVDLVEFPAPVDGIELFNGDLARMPVADRSVDLVISRSVMEHIVDPARAYAEIARVLRPSGSFVFLTGNFWDYAAIITNIVPNRFHPWIVARTQGRAEIDVFPTAYKTNTRAAVDKWAGGAGFEVVSYEYLGQYPTYFMFNGFLFLIATGYEKIISRFEVLRFLRGWILVVLRKPA
ncbi:MAG TPA: class I SAM-dependent methyltransferase [Burkholderiales bacterium]|nr:class I SAM-dependent methyltransferase [Burkholderiales bacterium]